MSFPFRPKRPLSPTDRFLKLFTDVRGGESTTALLLMLNVFLLLTAYYVIKVVREPLILAGGGAELKSYSSAGQAILLLGAVPLYGMLANHFPRRRLINLVTVFFVACLVVFYGLARLEVPIGVPFFLWVGIFNLMVIAQFWAARRRRRPRSAWGRRWPATATTRSSRSTPTRPTATWPAGWTSRAPEPGAA